MRFFFIFIIATLANLLPIGLHGQKVFISEEVKHEKDKSIPKALITIEGITTKRYSNNFGLCSPDLLLYKYKVVIPSVGYKTQDATITLHAHKKQNFVLTGSAVNRKNITVRDKSQAQRMCEVAYAANAKTIISIYSKF